VAGAFNTDINGFNAIEDCRLDERLRMGIKGGEMKARWYRFDGTRGAELSDAGELGRLEVGDGADSRGPVVSETRGMRSAREGLNQRGKRISHEDATDARAGWPGRAISAYVDGAAGGLAGPEAKRAAGSTGLKIRKKEISELKLDFWIYQGFGNL
jgi:hypothetical protein